MEVFQGVAQLGAVLHAEGQRGTEAEGGGAAAVEVDAGFVEPTL